MALCTKEAGKTIPDGVAEVREAVDLLRYYAGQARTLDAPESLPSPTGETNTLQMAGRGVFACISPWNFPLAIIIGQVRSEEHTSEHQSLMRISYAVICLNQTTQKMTTKEYSTIT